MAARALRGWTLRDWIDDRLTRPVVTDPPLRFVWPLALGFAGLCAWANFPGRLNQDSLFAVIAATQPGTANNWHSATLGWLWSLPAPWLGQPAAALLVQSIFFGLVAGFLPRTPATIRGRATLSLHFVFRLALVGGFGSIGKDIMLLGTLMLGTGLVLRGVEVGFGAARIAALGATTLLFLLVKAPDAFLLVAALALLLPFLVRSWALGTALLAGALALAALAVPLNRVVDRGLFGARDVHPDKQLILFDLAGIAMHGGGDGFARIPGWPRGLPSVQSCYLPYMWDSFAPWAPCRGYSAAFDAHDRAATRQWLRSIAGHPLAYAAHRADYLGELLRSQDHRSWGIGGAAVNDAADPAALAEMRALAQGLQADRPIALWRAGATTRPLAALEAAAFRYPKASFVGLIGALAILLTGWMRRRDGIRLGALLPASLAVGNVAMLAVFGVADPARYMLPTVALFYLACLALLAPSRR